MTTLLVLTVGQSDVQLAVDCVRHELEPKECGVLHDEIERRGYRLVDAPSSKAHQRMGSLPEGDLMLCTPKLDAVLKDFDGSPLPTAALIFDTRREFSSDPRLAGAILKRRLNELGVEAVCEPLLSGKERLEDPGDSRDAVVRRDVVNRPARALAEQYARTRPSNVVVATTGGLAAANAVVEELTRLYAVGCAEVRVLEVPDGAFNAQDDRAVPEKFHPAAGVRARWQALSLIQTGNLLGAWGAVSYLKDEPGQEWTLVVNWLSLFASSLPIPNECDIPVLLHKRMSVRAALRVELALRAGDIPRAVHGTVAFFEAALWDGLNEHFQRSDDPQRRRYFRVKSGSPVPSGDKLVRRGDRSDEDRKRPFEVKDTVDEVTWYWIFDGDGGPAARLAKRYLKRNGLEAFDKALGSEIRELRNDVAHNEPTPELMDEAPIKMRNAGLWSDSDTFISQELVQSVLSEVGGASAKLLDDLLNVVRQRVTKV